MKLKHILHRSAVLLLMSAILGCATHGRKIFDERVMAPEPPSFLVSPFSALLSSPEGISAELLGGDGSTQVVGRLFAKGGRLQYSPSGSDRSFIWDSATHSGYAISDALQGFAPIQSPMFATDIRTKSETAGNASVRVNALAGHEAEISVKTSDGAESVVRIWRTVEGNGFPARITLPASANSQVLNFANIKPAIISDRLFAPPEGFTAYASPSIMTSELMIRHSKTRNARPVSRDDLELPSDGAKEVHAPSRSR